LICSDILKLTRIDAKNETFVQFCKYKSSAHFSSGNFFLNQLFYRFNELLTAIKSIKDYLPFLSGRRFAIFALFCMCADLWSQQDAQFSQNMFNLLSVNPAYAGSSDMVNLEAISRQQYVGYEGNPKTTVFGADAAISPKGIDGGVGISFLNDQVGFVNEVGVNLSTAVKFRLNSAVLSTGAVIGFRNHVLNPEWYYGSGGSNDSYHQESDPDLVDGKAVGSTLDFGLGVYLKGSDYYAGLSVLHLLNPSPTFDQSYYYYFKRTVYLTAGKKYEMLDRPFAFSPSFFFKTDGVSAQIDLNCNVYYKKRYWGGLSYRYQDAVVLLAGLETKNGLRIGYSFDIPTSAVAKTGQGGHEVSIGYSFEMSIEKRKKQYKSVRYL
jgi:type IX secretion system PorP/SprF family membrane protein